MKISRYQERDHDAWNRFVTDCPQGTFFHLAEWIAITESYYGFSSCSFLIREGEEIVGVVPLFLCQSPFLGKCLIPTPICGRLNFCTVESKAETAIWKEIERLLIVTRARFAEMRLDFEHELAGLPTNREHVLQPLFLEKAKKDQWEKLKPAVRNKIRQAEKYGPECISGHGEYFPAFYDIYAANMRDFAYPLLGKKFFDLLRQKFAGMMEFLVLKHGGAVRAALINFYFKDTVTNLWGVSSKKHRHLRINNYLYCEALKIAINKGYTVFDFGRARRGSGVYEFKKQWGATTVPLSYQYLSGENYELPSVGDTEKKFRLPMAVWRHLPVAVTKMLGPPLGRWMPL